LADHTAQQIIDAEQAAHIIGHRLHKMAWGGIKDAIHEMLAEVNMHDTAGQKELLRSLKNLERVREAYERAINDGFVAKESLRRSKIKELVGL
jgi:hypothetical protein